MPDRINVTSPALASLDDFRELLQGPWQSGILTHNGPLVQKLEHELQSVLKCAAMRVVTNGTMAIQLAIRALGIRGEIITTPFTWLATSRAIEWEGCKPVFVDIDPETLNLDPEKVESSITKDTVAVLPVHVFGNACDLEGFETLVKQHRIKLIYDAAHAVGVEINGTSILNYGDISATSFHATKIFNTGEGGGCVSTDVDLINKISELRFFGFRDGGDVGSEGLNGKMTEIHAALGLVNLPLLNDTISHRKRLNERYRENLNSAAVHFQKLSEATNVSYFPVIFSEEEVRDSVESRLNMADIFPRRYFYPSLDSLSCYPSAQTCTYSRAISERILCLPSHNGVSIQDVDRISQIIVDAI